jgi:hypothetical protein
MLIECQRFGDRQLLHQDEGDAIGEGESLVGVLLEVTPAIKEQILIDLNQLNVGRSK